MKNFTYYRPVKAEQAVALLADKWGPTEVLAGGEHQWLTLTSGQITHYLRRDRPRDRHRNGDRRSEVQPDLG